MHESSRTTLSTASAAFILSTMALADVRPQGAAPESGAAAMFREANPGTGLFIGASNRVERIYGKAFSSGATALESAEKVRTLAAALWGVQPADLVAGSTMADGRAMTGVSWDSQRNDFKFMLVSYLQTRGGIPVFDGHLRLLARNEPGFPIVLASANVRDIGAFAVDPALAAGVDVRLFEQRAITAVGGGVIHTSRIVIFAGAYDDVVKPRLAVEAHVVNEHQEWRVVIDIETGAALHTEDLICFQTVSGVAQGNSTTGLGSEQCEPEVATALPYVKVTGGRQTVFTDASGNYSLTSAGTVRTIDSTLDGQWFDIFDAAGFPTSVSVPTNGAATNLLYNSANTDPLVRSQVNAYVAANLERDFVLAYNPSYPTLNSPDFTVTVNRTDGFCPGNAWYSPSDPSINFCQADSGHPNTAFASVVYHEYGHHLVNAGGSGQGPYGEGMGDVMSVLMLDSPLLGLGFFNDCNSPLRTADNDCQFSATSCSSCGSESHACGNLISGCVWDLRQNLFAADPIDYRDTLADLAINSILLHNGTTINAGITIDFLTLDDDNGDITDGTPHYAEIASAFGLHGLPAPALAPFKFVWVGGVPTHFDPAGSLVTLDVVNVNSKLDPSTAKFFYRIGAGAWTGATLVAVDSDTYQASVPPGTCNEEIQFYSLGQGVNAGVVVTDPPGASAAPYQTLFGYGPLVETFSDNFETSLGWTVQNGAGFTDGSWERATPISDCDRGAPTVDADGSGKCYLTDNDPNTCNSDVDGGPTLLISPVLDATVPNAYLSYWRWYSNIAGNSPYQDTFKVDVSNDNGASWTALEVVGPTGAQVEGGWYYKQFRIADVIAPTNQFRVRFTANDTDPGSVVEAGVDGVKILSLDCTPPSIAGDLDGDGHVSGSDLGVFLGQWGGAGAADLDGSGIVDAADLGIMLGNWG